MSWDPEDVRAAWLSQPVDPPRFDAGALAGRASALEVAVRSRNRREYAAAAVVGLAFSGVAWAATNPWSRVGSVGIVLAAGFIAWTLRTRGSPGDPTSDTRSWLAAELRRERDLLAEVGRWYLGPLVPGLTLFFLGPALNADGVVDLAVVGAGAVLSAGVFLGIYGLNHRAAAALDRELAEVERA